MPKKLNFRLDETELQLIKHAIAHHRRPEVRQRAIAIHLLHEGMRPDEVALTLAVTRGSVYRWHQLWREGGVDGLANRPRTDAKRIGEPTNEQPNSA